MIDLDFLKKYAEKITRAKQEILAFWNLEDIEKIPTTVWAPGFFSFSKGLLCSPGDYYRDKELNLQVQVEAIHSHLENLQDAYLPHIDSYIGTPVIASAFGGEVTYFHDKDPWLAQPIIHEYKDIDRIKKPDPKESGLMKKIFEWVDYWKLQTQENIPVSMTDIQGPLSVAIDLMGADRFFMGLIDDPKRIKILLEIITEVTIDFLHLLYPKIEVEDGIHEWAGIFFPKGRGRLRLSEDNLISISPEMYRDFLHPYNEEILHRLGGGFIHWCGNGNNNFENVLTTKNLTGVHNSSMGDMKLILDQIARIQEVNEAEGKKTVYFSSMVLPTTTSSVQQLLKRQHNKKGVMNCIFYTLDGYGVSFESEDGKGGYAKLEDNPGDIVNQFFARERR